MRERESTENKEGTLSITHTLSPLQYVVGGWKAVIVYKLNNGSALRVLLPPMDMNLCSLGTKPGCPNTKVPLIILDERIRQTERALSSFPTLSHLFQCSSSVHGGLRIFARDCPLSPQCHLYCREVSPARISLPPPWVYCRRKTEAVTCSSSSMPCVPSPASPSFLSCRLLVVLNTRAEAGLSWRSSSWGQPFSTPS